MIGRAAGKTVPDASPPRSRLTRANAGMNLHLKELT